MGNHQESSKAKRFLLGLLFTLHLMATFSASALQTGDDGRVGESKHHERVYDERRIASPIPSRGIRKTLRLQSLIHADPGAFVEAANTARSASVNTKAIVIAAPIAGVVGGVGILLLCIWCCRS